MFPRDQFIFTSVRVAKYSSGLLALLIGQSICFAQPAESNNLANGQGGALHEPTEGDRPASAGRVVRAFDFEEKDYNPLPVPLGWIRAQEDPEVPRIRPGFPIWNGALLDFKTPAYSGIGSVILPTAGGSTSLILRRGEINIFPNADYIISVRTRTSGLKFAKARVVARLLDQFGEQIESAESASELVSTDGEWEQVAIEIEGVYNEAAFIQVELQLLQPKQQFEANAIVPFAVWEQDYSGAAWFDNLIIAQLPRLEISTGTDGNIIESDTIPVLKLLVRDLTGDQIVAKIRVFDVHSNQVDSETLVDGSKRVRLDWVPKLPGFGWYRAMLEVEVDDQLVGVRTLDFIWTSPNSSNNDSGMFGIQADITNPKVAQSASVLIKGTGVTNASIELWNERTTLASLDKESIEMQAISELIDMGTDLRITVAQLPAQLAIDLAKDTHEVLPVFAGDSKSWVQWGSGMFDQFGQAVQKWQFSDIPTQEDAVILNGYLDSIADSLTGYVPGPILVTPWSIDRPIESQAVSSSQEILIIDNNATNDKSMEIVVEDWIQAVDENKNTEPGYSPSLGMVLSPLHQPGQWSGVESWSSVGTLARKAISFWWHASLSQHANERFDLELKDAWWISPGKRGQVMPAPELVVWRTLATHLGSREAIQELSFVPGVRMLVAGDKISDGTQGQGILVVWLDDPALDSITLNLPLADGPVSQFDMFNNEKVVPLDYVGGLGLPVHQIKVGRSPLIIHGINTQLVRFLNSIELSPNKLQSQSGVHKHELMLHNPWPLTIRGKIYIVEPGGYTGSSGDIDRSWEIQPRVVPFVLDADESRNVPIDIAYSLGELAGMKALTYDVEISADTDYPLMRVQREIELGLEGIDMRLAARKGADGITVVTVQVTNSLSVEQDFEVTAIPPNEARLRKSISAIKPGEKISREFAFTKANSGDQIIVALILRESSIRLNKSVIVP
ncbi:MAG: hypothetical protein P1U42_06510 [Phycisphaerales bacterium]|nr:hypothetical protein [Phycisphaerales bacterium]